MALESSSDPILTIPFSSRSPSPPPENIEQQSVFLFFGISVSLCFEIDQTLSIPLSLSESQKTSIISENHPRQTRARALRAELQLSWFVKTKRSASHQYPQGNSWEMTPALHIHQNPNPLSNAHHSQCRDHKSRSLLTREFPQERSNRKGLPLYRPRHTSRALRAWPQF